MKISLLVPLLVSTVAVLSIQALADSSCSAKNDSGGTCSITCPTGQSASCSDTTGANPPICKCVTPSGLQAARSMPLLSKALDEDMRGWTITTYKTDLDQWHTSNRVITSSAPDRIRASDVGTPLRANHRSGCN